MLSNLLILALFCNFKLPILQSKWWLKHVNVADDFEIDEKQMTVFLLNQELNASLFWAKRNFLNCYMPKVTITGQIFHTGWKYGRFNLKLLDEEERLSDFRFTKQDVPCFWASRYHENIKSSCCLISWDIFYRT